jgi:N-acetylated-alpha-linked acidic dipeptidase
MSSNERAPLLAVVRIAPPRQRYSHSTLRRFCTIALATTLIIVVILFLLPIQWLPAQRSRPHKHWPESNGLPYKELQRTLQSVPDARKARGWSEYYTAGPHLAGKNLSQAMWTKDRWEEFGVTNTEIISYDTYINYPVGHRLALLEKSTKAAGQSTGDIDGKKTQLADYKVNYECSLEEDVLKEDRTTGLTNRIPTFHGYSASGNVTAQFVYVNFGTFYDFEDLVKANITLKGKIAIVKYGKIFRGLKVKRAEELGMIGVVIYSDLQEDNGITEENGYKAYPDGPARNPSSVQRGSVQFLSTFSCQLLEDLANEVRRSSRRSYNARLPFEARSASSRSSW